MLIKSDSLLCAEYIVACVQNDIRTANVNGYIESYQNGREQGLLIWLGGVTNIAYYICHPRNGSSPYVYRGRYSMQSISDDAYNHKNSFKYEHEAIEWIIEDILNTLNLDKWGNEKELNE